MTKVQNSGIAQQIKNFTIEAAGILTAAAPGLLIIVILVAATAAAFIEWTFHAKVVGESFALVSGGGYGLFRFSVGSAGVMVAKENRWVPAIFFILISLGFTVWSSYHVDAAAEMLRIGGTPEAAQIILLTVLWTAFAGEICLGVYSFVMESQRAEKEPDPNDGTV